MRDPNRIPTVLAAVEALWRQYPDQRFIQLVSNLIPHGRMGFYIEDEELMDLLAKGDLYGGRKEDIDKNEWQP